LPDKPLKVNSSPIVLTEHKSNWIPPVNHPWRQFRYSQRDLVGQIKDVSNYISS